MQEAKREHWGVCLINFGDRTPTRFIPGKAQYLEGNQMVDVELPEPYMVYANKFEMKKELVDVLQKMIHAMEAEEQQCLSTNIATQ